MRVPTASGGRDGRMGGKRASEGGTDVPAMAAAKRSPSAWTVFTLVLAVRILALGLPSTGLPAGLASALGIAVAFGAIPLLACGPREVAAAVRPMPSVGAALLGIALGAINYVPALALSNAFTVLSEGAGVPTDPFQNCAGGFDRAFLVLAIVPLAPLLEEIAFRGVMQRKACGEVPPWLAILLISTGFALVHLDGLHQIPARLEMGLVFGIATYRSGAVWMAVAAHLAHNGLALAALLLLGQNMEFPGGLPALGLAALASAAAVAAVLWKSKRLAVAG